MESCNFHLNLFNFWTMRMGKLKEFRNSDKTSKRRFWGKCCIRIRLRRRRKLYRRIKCLTRMLFLRRLGGVFTCQLKLLILLLKVRFRVKIDYDQNTQCLRVKIWKSQLLRHLHSQEQVGLNIFHDDSRRRN